MKKYGLFLLSGTVLPILFMTISCKSESKGQSEGNPLRDSTKIDREYSLEASMLGYFANDGTRNPTLYANKGDRVRIIITNGETMTHDIAREKMGIKSGTILEKGTTTNITFWAENNDTYYCTIPGHRMAGMVGEFKVVEGDLSAPAIAGIVPMKNGKPLNVGFERGNLSDWKAEGDAFKDPLFNRPSPVHEVGEPIGFDGDFFLSSGGTKNYKLKGTLSSVPFEVTYPFASFRISGGALADTRVEIVEAETEEVIFKSTGQGRATLQPVVVDLNDYLNRNIFIRIIDNESGISPIPYIGDDVWAHISFDDFLFYPSRPNFSNELY